MSYSLARSPLRLPGSAAASAAAAAAATAQKHSHTAL